MNRNDGLHMFYNVLIAWRHEIVNIFYTEYRNSQVLAISYCYNL